MVAKPVKRVDGVHVRLRKEISILKYNRYRGYYTFGPLGLLSIAGGLYGRNVFKR